MEGNDVVYSMTNERKVQYGGRRLSMVRRLVELVLIVAIAVGGYLAWQTGRERGRLQQTFDRLARKAGDLRIEDPTRVHICAIPTGEPLHFAWRVYLPANYTVNVNVKTGSSSGSNNGVPLTKPQEFIARVRCREDENGILNVYSKFAGGSTRMGVGDQAFAKLLRGRWNEVVVEQMAADRLDVVEPDKSLILLRLRLPADIEKDAKTALSPGQLEPLIPVFFEMQLGKPASQPNG
jgi:hypothetical protein